MSPIQTSWAGCGRTTTRCESTGVRSLAPDLTAPYTRANPRVDRMPIPSDPLQSDPLQSDQRPSDPRPSDPRISLPEQPTVLDIASAATADGQILEEGQRVGPYRIDRLLGMGGMGAVYLAEQLEPIQRKVALKLIKGQLRGGLAEAYFLVERQALARMDHPAIAKVFDAGSTPQGHLF